MWSFIIGKMPSGTILLCAILAFVIPYSIYWINKELHKYGDPPWKTQPDQEEQKDPQQNCP